METKFALTAHIFYANQSLCVVAIILGTIIRIKAFDELFTWKAYILRELPLYLKKIK